MNRGDCLVHIAKHMREKCECVSCGRLNSRLSAMRQTEMIRLDRTLHWKENADALVVLMKSDALHKYIDIDRCT